MKGLACLVLIASLSLNNCSSSRTSIKGGCVEVYYQKPNGEIVSADSLKWYERSWHRQLIFDDDCDGIPDYSYWELYDDVAGWIWLHWTVRINPEENPDLARKKPWLVAPKDTIMPSSPSLDDFGYKKRR